MNKKVVILNVVPRLALAVACLSPLTTLAAKSAKAIEYSDGRMVYYYDDADHSGDDNYVKEWSAYQTKEGKSPETTITTIVIDSSFDGWQPQYLSGYFRGLKDVTTIEGLEYLDASKALAMASMFQGCASLRFLDLSGFKTPLATSMKQMFNGCSALETVDLTSFDKSSLTDASYMFNACSSLTTVYVTSDFALSGVETTTGAFGSCAKLQGDCGTKYDKTHVDGAYGRLDGGAEAPGYFSRKYRTLTIDSTAFAEKHIASVSVSTNGVAVEATSGATYSIEHGIPATITYAAEGGYDFHDANEQTSVADDRFATTGLKADATLAGDDIPTARETNVYRISYYLGNVHYEGADENFTNTEEHVIAFTNPVVSVGYAFAGWHDNAELTGDAVTCIPVNTKDDISLFAAETPIGPTNLVWNGSVDGDWSNGRNWTPNKVPTADDDVTFAGAATPVVLVKGMAFKSFTLAGDVTFAVTNDYTISFVIAGTGDITKIGAGNLTISSANTYVGTLTVGEGTVTRNNAQAFGLAANALVVTNATLNLGGYNKNNVRHALTLEEGGVVDASGNLQGYSGLSSVTLTGDAFVRCDTERETSPTLCKGSLLMKGHTLTKVGAGAISLTASSWSESDKGVVFVKEGCWRDAYASSASLTLTNLTLRLNGGATYYESQNLYWGGVRAVTNALATCYKEYSLRVAKEISGGLTAERLSLSADCVYKPLVAGDRLTVSNSFAIGTSSQHKMIIDVTALDLATLVHGELLPLLITPQVVDAGRVKEVRTLRGRWPVYTRVRDDGMYELGVCVRNAGATVFLVK